MKKKENNYTKVIKIAAIASAITAAFIMLYPKVKAAIKRHSLMCPDSDDDYEDDYCEPDEDEFLDSDEETVPVTASEDGESRETQEAEGTVKVLEEAIARSEQDE